VALQRQHVAAQFPGTCADAGVARSLSNLTLIRRGLPKELIEEMFAFVLKLALEKKQLKARAIGLDATTLEANAAMKSIVRRDGGASWKAYLTKLAKEAASRVQRTTNSGCSIARAMARRRATTTGSRRATRTRASPR
jgi:hypothetical protein